MSAVGSDSSSERRIHQQQRHATWIGSKTCIHNHFGGKKTAARQFDGEIKKCEMADEEASAMVVDSVAPVAPVAAGDTAAVVDVNVPMIDAAETTNFAAAVTDLTVKPTEVVAADANTPIDAAVPVVENAPLVALTPEIRWHCGPTGLNEAVLSIDFLHPNSKQQQLQDTDASAAPQHQPTILATGGADKEIKLWRVSDDLKDHTGLEFVFSLSGHDRSVNCVRFSPNGEFLASASDDSTIILWTKPKTAAEDWAWDKIASFSDVSRTLLACGHKGDITDLAWSPDSAFLCSTSVDNTSVIWNVEKGEVEERRKDHTQYVQGVAWDPLNEYLVTEGNDRSCRVYSLNGFDPVSRLSSKKVPKKCVCVQTIKTREFPAPKTVSTGTTGSSTTQPENGNTKAKPEELKVAADTEPKQPTSGETTTTTTTTEDSAARTAAAPKHRMFLDDTCPAFARRPTWTPDGNYFLAPTGIFRSTESASPVNTVYAFARGNLSEPTLHLPGQEKASLGVRCSPLLYELRCPAAADGGDDADAKQQPVRNFFQTPHRSIFAVITLNTVVIYDTQQAHPICTLKDLHYADLTDVSWSRDGQLLSISSMDGYLSFIKFQDGFFGTSISKSGHVAMNQQKMRTMFATPKLARAKKHKAPQALQASADDVNGGGAVKKKMKVSTPAVRKKADVKASEAVGSLAATGATGAQPAQQQLPSSVAGGVNTLQVRKKRKITPVLVTSSSPVAAPTPVPAAVAASVSTTDALSSTNTADTPSQAKQETASTTTETQAQQQTETANDTNGSAEDPIML